MLWVDKHRPSRLDELSYHDHVTKRLKALASQAPTEGMPHLFFYGPSGSGKKTRVTALLRELYGPSAERLKLDKRTFTTPTTKRIVEINMVTSNHHIEMSPGDAGLNDRFVVQDIIKEMASNTNIAASVTAATAGDGKNDGSIVATNNKKQYAKFKTVVLLEVDRLSRQAQAALRRTMEKYSSTCRLILVADNQSKVMEPVRSRCLGLRIAAPSVDDVALVLQKSARREAITVPHELTVNVARESNRNVRRALLMLEAAYVATRGNGSGGGGGGMNANQPVQKTDWELYIAQLAQEITKEQSPQKLGAAREKLYELLVNCIPATVILKTLCRELLHNLDDGLKMEVIEWAAFYEHRIAATGSNKEIFHLEAFVAKYMAIYKKFLNDMFA
jgi:replication factor C subunit 3/5